MAEDRIDLDDAGGVDDVVLNEVEMFRLERMSDTGFWARCYRQGKPDIVFRLGVEGGRLVVLHEQDEDDEEHEGCPHGDSVPGAAPGGVYQCRLCDAEWEVEDSDEEPDA